MVNATVRHRYFLQNVTFSAFYLLHDCIALNLLCRNSIHVMVLNSYKALKILYPMNIPNIEGGGRTSPQMLYLVSTTLIDLFVSDSSNSLKSLTLD